MKIEHDDGSQAGHIMLNHMMGLSIPSSIHVCMLYLDYNNKQWRATRLRSHNWIVDESLKSSA